MKRITGLLLLATILLTAIALGGPPTFQSQANGNWSALSTWQWKPAGTGAWQPATRIPTAGDVVNVTRTVSLDIDGACGVLSITGTLRVGSATLHTLTVDGVTISGAGTLGGATDGISLALAGNTTLSVTTVDLNNLTVGATRALALAGNATVHGALAVDGGLTSDNAATARTLTLSGTVTNNGTIGAPTNNYLTLAFASDMTLAGTGTTTLSGLSVAAAKTLTLGQAATVQSSLTLNGNVVLGANNLTITGAAVSGAGFAITDGTGKVVAAIGAALSQTFPVAVSATETNALVITSASGDTYSVSVASGLNPATPVPAAYVNATWTVLNTGSSTFSATFNWVAGQEVGTMGSADAYGCSDGASWIDQGPVTLASQSASTVAALTLSGTYAIADNSTPLPVQVASFKPLMASSNSVTLAWETVSEVNNYGFEVWRSASATTGFQKVSDLIAGHGTTLEHQSYSWTDATPNVSEPYYRLRQIDANGTTRDLEVITVNFSLTSVNAIEAAPKVFQLMQNYPNPFNPSTMIKFSVEKAGQTEVTVYNSLGQQVATLFNGMAEAGRYYQVRFDARDYASGIYFYRLTSGSKTSIAKMLLVK